jgi:hypothetical protein
MGGTMDEMRLEPLAVEEAPKRGVVENLEVDKLVAEYKTLAKVRLRKTTFTISLVFRPRSERTHRVSTFLRVCVR